jgi:hypothetical protein
MRLKLIIEDGEASLVDCCTGDEVSGVKRLKLDFGAGELMREATVTATILVDRIEVVNARPPFVALPVDLPKPPTAEQRQMLRKMFPGKRGKGRKRNVKRA